MLGDFGNGFVSISFWYFDFISFPVFQLFSISWKKSLDNFVVDVCSVSSLLFLFLPKKFCNHLHFQLV